MAKRKVLQTDFSAGEITPSAKTRRDTTQYEKGAASLLNGQGLIAGGDRRRPGTLRKARKSGEFRMEPFVYDASTRYVLGFGDGVMYAWLEDGTPAGEISGAPWTGDIWRTMDYDQRGNVVLLTHREMMRHVVRETANTWSEAAWPWSESVSGRIKQPHFKVAPDDMTITPSALTGSITVELSDDWWVPEHVGTRIRILDRELEITVVTDGDTATATVLDPLRPFQDLTVTSSAGFAVDEVVEGQTTGARGVICSIPDGTSIIVAVIENMTKFTAEGLIGPQITTTIGSVADASTAPVSDWTEQAYSDIYGYPDAVRVHRNRILLAGGGAVPNGLSSSSLGDIFDHDIGDGSDTDGFFETVGDGAASLINALHSAEQLLLGTDKGLYYVPESETTPFRPTSIQFNAFGDPWEISRVRPGSHDGGVIFTAGSTIIKATPTGDLRRAWDAREVQYLAAHMLGEIVDSAFVNNFGGDERFGIFVNDDGTAAIMMLVDKEEIRNFRPWNTEGAFKSMCSLPGKLYACVERQANGTTIYQLEIFDHGITLDGAIEGDDLDAMAADLATDEPHVMTASGHYLGTYPLALENVPAGPYVMGLFFNRVIQTLPPDIQDEEGSRAGAMMRICEAQINVLESRRFAANGHTLAAYYVHEDPTVVAPLRTGWQRFTFLGWSKEPTITITQPDPLPLTVLGINPTVLF